MPSIISPFLSAYRHANSSERSAEYPDVEVVVAGAGAVGCAPKPNVFGAAGAGFPNGNRGSKLKENAGAAGAGAAVVPKLKADEGPAGAAVKATIINVKHEIVI